MKQEFVLFKDIQEPFFVRVGLDEGRVRYFKEIYENKGEVDRPLLTEKRELIDGRHRIAALKRINRDGVECNIIPNAPKEDLIIRAFKANSGGPKPPTQDDLDHTIEILLEEDVSRQTILQQMTSTIPFPRQLVRRHINDVQSKMAKRRLNDAIEAMANEKLNLTVREAAEKFRVELSALRSRLKVSSAKTKKMTEVSVINGGLTKSFQSFVMKNSYAMRKAIVAYNDGEIGYKDAVAIVEHAKHFVKQLDHSIREWEKRLKKQS